MRLLILLLLFFSYAAQAQITMDEFLHSVMSEPEVQAFVQQNTFLESNPYRLSVIRRLEFRTESNQLDPQRQDYALRLNPANPWELKHNKQYFQTYQELLQLDQGRIIKESLKTRYEAIINWAYIAELKKIRQEETETTKRLLAILEGQRYSDYFDANDYVELRVDQLERIIALEEVYSEMDHQRNQIDALYPKAKLQPIDWNIAHFITLENIEAIVDSMDYLEIGGEIAYREKKIDLVNSEYALEKSNINVGYLQAQYQQYRVEQDRSPWNIALGVTIPIFNPNKGDMAKRKLDIFEAEGDLLKAKEEHQTGRVLAKAKIKQLLERYHSIHQQLEELNVDALASSLQQIKGNNPMVIVQMEINLAKAKTITARLKKDIYLTYITYLEYSEMLQQQPLKNYLTTIH